MLYLVKKRFDSVGNDLAPAGSRMTDALYLTHIELSDNTEGAVIGTDEDEILNNTLVTEKIDALTLAEEIVAAIVEDLGGTE